MKRFQKALLGVVVSGALLFSAQAAGITNTSDTANDILQSALSTVQQEWKASGKIETTYFPNEYGFVHIIDLLPEKNLYTVNFSFDDGVFSYKFGILRKALNYGVFNSCKKRHKSHIKRTFSRFFKRTQVLKPCVLEC